MIITRGEAATLVSPSGTSVHASDDVPVGDGYSLGSGPGHKGIVAVGRFEGDRPIRPER
ncbi:hypothetical protein [Halogeometricum pallidum]|uniref:hypothetical protein n=1 Tax=Halogeometricum pallidum TaxID=411361 RepID=UPI001360B2D6|nr:hypothetical protein [Halogeometricum pallidum]